MTTCQHSPNEMNYFLLHLFSWNLPSAKYIIYISKKAAFYLRVSLMIFFSILMYFHFLAIQNRKLMKYSTLRLWIVTKNHGLPWRKKLQKGFSFLVLCFFLNIIVCVSKYLVNNMMKWKLTVIQLFLCGITIHVW